MEKFMPMIQNISMIITGIVIIATVIAQMTKTEKDDKVVSKVKKVLRKIVQFLPTIGINPQTKEMKEQLAKLEEKS